MKKCLAFLTVLLLAALPAAAQSVVLSYDDGTYEAFLALSPTEAPAVQFDAPGTGVFALDSVSISLDGLTPGTYPLAVQVWDASLAPVQTIPWNVAFTGAATYTLDLTNANLPFTGSVRIGVFLRVDPLVPVPGMLSLGLDTLSLMPFGHSYAYNSLAVPPADPWGAVSIANCGIQAAVHVVPAMTCQGFLPPMNRTVSMKKGGRTLPLKALLFDEAGAPMTRDLLSSPPLVQLFYSAAGEEPVDVTDFIAPAGRSNSGQAFRSTRGGTWMYNLKTGKNLPPGTYTVQVGSGDVTGYAVDPTCTGTFVIENPTPKKPHPPKGPKK